MSCVENLEDQFKQLSGPDGFVAFENDLLKLEQNLHSQITLLQGQLQSLGVVKRLFSAHKKSWGVDLKDPKDSPVFSNTVKLLEETEISKERQHRLSQLKCTYKAKGGKWCERKLKTKDEQNSGYCSAHMIELGLSANITK